ncbi:NAC transcription factor 47 [Gossypium hirsutum]|uniref:NAC transcription factor 47 n=1 Tax=Gossypium hirsutum TaxID=3635 RepID=A0ABM3BJJ6_GOSHI|nr:NAC transcription factor 47-like [Gossypium hirsutum]
MRHPHSSVPPGFRFHLTDEELILHYLMKKLSSSAFPVSIIADADFYSSIPGTYQVKLALITLSMLSSKESIINHYIASYKAVLGEKEWYIFRPRDGKYPNGARPNSATGDGFWKATGTDKIIVASSMAAGRGGVHSNIGVKKALVFHRQNKPSTHL